MTYRYTLMLVGFGVLWAAPPAQCEDSAKRDRTAVHGIEIWLGATRVTPKQSDASPTPRLIESAATRQAVALQSEATKATPKTEQEFTPVPAVAESSSRLTAESRRQEKPFVAQPSDHIPVWRLPSHPSSWAVETRLSGSAPNETGDAPMKFRTRAVSEIGDIPSSASTELINEAVRLLNESIELNQRAHSLLKSLNGEADCAGCSFEPIIEPERIDQPTALEPVSRRVNMPAQVISTLLTDIPQPDIPVFRRDQVDTVEDMQHAVTATLAAPRAGGLETAVQLSTFSLPMGPGLREVAVVVVVLLMAVLILEAMTQNWHGGCGWLFGRSRSPAAARQVAEQQRRSEAKPELSGSASDLVAAVIAQNVGLRRQLVQG